MIFVRTVSKSYSLLELRLVIVTSPKDNSVLQTKPKSLCRNEKVDMRGCSTASKTTKQKQKWTTSSCCYCLFGLLPQRLHLVFNCPQSDRIGSIFQFCPEQGFKQAVPPTRIDIKSTSRLGGNYCFSWFERRVIPDPGQHLNKLWTPNLIFCDFHFQNLLNPRNVSDVKVDWPWRLSLIWKWYEK